MTGRYDWNPMPHVLDVRCPGCGGQATFEFAEIVKIRRRTEVAFFEASPQFEVRWFGDSAGARWRGAIFRPGLHGGTAAIWELPCGYQAREWDHSRYLYRPHGLDLGSVCCTACGRRAAHELSWPADAWFQIEFKRQILWAYHRESALALLDHLRSDDRREERSAWGAFLLHVPTVFKTRKARETVVERWRRHLRV